MNDDTKKALYVNLLLLAMADGKIDPAERDYLHRFTSTAGVTPAEASAWQKEIRKGKIGFLPVSAPGDVEDALAVMARMVRVDGAFDAAEQDAYVSLGKALGVSEEQLGGALRKVWNADPELKRFEAKPQPTAVEPPKAAPQKSAVTILVIEDELDDRNGVEQAAPRAHLSFIPMGAATGGTPPNIVAFHVSDDRPRSKEMLDTLTARYPSAKVVFIARRDQSPQIGWLLGLGAARCFVEPLYANEIDRAAGELLR